VASIEIKMEMNCIWVLQKALLKTESPYVGDDRSFFFKEISTQVNPL
jgi:hypothetical protein